MNCVALWKQSLFTLTELKWSQTTITLQKYEALVQFTVSLIEVRNKYNFPSLRIHLES